MMTLKKLNAMRNKAERCADDWSYKYSDELDALYVIGTDGRLTVLKDVYADEYNNDRSIADTVESANVTVYEEDWGTDDGKYKECTRRAISRLRKLEQKVREWSNKYYFLDCAVDEWIEDYDDETNTRRLEASGTLRDLAALGISIS